jgi:hypothetical protein
MRNRGNGNRNRNTEVIRVDFQLQEGANTEPATDAAEEVSNKVKDTDFGEVRKGTFTIKVTGKKKNEETKKIEDVILYENKEEPFEYDYCSSIANALKHAGAKLSEDQIDFLGTALKSEDTEVDKTIGEAIAKILKTYNAKLKADAKSSQYQSLVNKHKPLEGEEREVAIAKTIRGFVKLSGISVETAIEVLKAQKAVPSDYTVEDYNATPLRRTKGDEDEE